VNYKDSACQALRWANLTSTSTAFKQCMQHIPVPVLAHQYSYSQLQVNSNIDAIDWTVNTTTWGMADFTVRQTGKVTVDQTFNIAAELCYSLQSSGEASVLETAAVGRGFDQRYYCVEVNTVTACPRVGPISRQYKQRPGT
jgi:hypothetical protein